MEMGGSMEFFRIQETIQPQVIIENLTDQFRSKQIMAQAFHAGDQGWRQAHP